MSPVPPDPGRTTSLPILELQRTTTSNEACSVLLRFAVEDCGIEKVAVLTGSDRQLRGLRQCGSGAPVEHVTVDLDEVDPALGRALGNPARGTVRVDTVKPTAIGFSSMQVFPMPGLDGGVVAAVVVDAETFHGDPLEMARVLLECAPALSRVVELEELGRNYKRASRQQRLLHFMLNSLPDPVLLTDDSNRIVLSNSRADDLFVSRTEHAEGRRRAVGLNNLFFTSHLTESTVSGVQRHGVSELDLTDPEYGADLYFEVLSFPVDRSDDLQATRITVLRDITDLKKALWELEDQISQAQIQEHRAVQESGRLQAIIGNAGKPILVTDPSSNIVLFNAEAERLLEVPSDTKKAGRIQTNAVRENHAQITSVLSEFLLLNEPRQTRRVDLRDPQSGDSVPHELVSSLIVGDRGEVTAVVSILRDLRPIVANERLARELKELNEELEGRVRDATSELKKRNRELKEQARIVERASRAKSEFLASVSHELRTPINAILGYTALIQERIYGEISDDQAGALGKVERASKHLLSLISDILDLSTIEAGRLPMSIDEFTLVDLVNSLEETIAPLVRDAGLELRTEISDEDVAFQTDQTRLQQILLNLLANAVKFTDEGTVILRAEVDGKYVRFEVEDTGVGIEEDEIESVFESFTQSAWTREAHRGGAGLGLAISVRLAEMMRGSLDVESSVGEGSVFTLRVPMTLAGQSTLGRGVGARSIDP